jgi:hypothetical protein
VRFRVGQFYSKRSGKSACDNLLSVPAWADHPMLHTPQGVEKTSLKGNAPSTNNGQLTLSNPGF